MTLDSLKNSNIHTSLIEEIRKLTEMRKINCKIQFSCFKVHVGILGKELADALAKKAAKKADIIEYYKILPKSVVISELGERSVEKWQRMGPNNKGTNHKRIFPGSD